MDPRPDRITVKQKSDAKYKDTLFRTLFRDKEKAIELCNAVAKTNYASDARVVICDLETALLKRYNDLAFAFENEIIVMFEHQSSINPNMPLRFLPYISDTLYSWFIEKDRIYGSTLVKVPTPLFYVLYNGTEKIRHGTLKLSDAFKARHGGPSMELAVKVLDINYGSGHEALARSESLNGYAYLITQIRHFERAGLKRDAAIKKAIQKCIDEKVLADFLKENFEEVADMLTWEYDQAAEFNVIREEGRKEGRKEGKKEGRAEGKEETKIETVMAMLKKGFDVPLIAEIIKMPTEWVKKVMASQTDKTSPETSTTENGSPR